MQRSPPAPAALRRGAAPQKQDKDALRERQQPCKLSPPAGREAELPRKEKKARQLSPGLLPLRLPYQHKFSKSSGTAGTNARRKHLAVLHPAPSYPSFTNAFVQPWEPACLKPAFFFFPCCSAQLLIGSFP